MCWSTHCSHESGRGQEPLNLSTRGSVVCARDGLCLCVMAGEGGREGGRGEKIGEGVWEERYSDDRIRCTCLKIDT